MLTTPRSPGSAGIPASGAPTSAAGRGSGLAGGRLTAVVLAVATVILVTATVACGGSGGSDRAAGPQAASGPASAESAGAVPDASADPGAPSASGPGGTGSRSPGLSGTDLPTIKNPAGPPKLPNDVVSPVTVRGVVRIAGSCTLLATDTATWTLVGLPAPGVRDGDRIEVVGLPAPQEETGCAGGALHVRSLHQW